MASKPKHFFTVEAALAKMRKEGRQEICAGLPLQMERMMANKGMTQNKLAKATGLANTYIGEVRRLEKFPGLEWWGHMAEYFGMLVEDFIAESRMILRGKITL